MSRRNRASTARKQDKKRWARLRRADRLYEPENKPRRKKQAG